jgi:membrane protein required for colicin V production
MTPDIFDLAVLAIILISALLAFARGFVREILSVVAWIGAAAASVYLFRFAQPVARTYIEVELVADVVAGVVVFIVVLIALSLMSHALSRRVRDSALGPLDRTLGLVFGLVRGAAVVALAYLVFTAVFPDPASRPEWITQARSEPWMQKGAVALTAILPERWIAKSVNAADEAKRAADQALRSGKAAQPLAEPIFKTAPAAEPKPGAAADPGYKDQERKDLQRLIQGSQ